MTVLAPAPRPLEAKAPPLPRLDPVTRLPILILFPHSRCNCRCLMCDIWQAKGREELSVEEIAGSLAEWRAFGVRRVVLSGGEPLMHAHFLDLCRALRAAEIGITILSTGLLLERYAADLPGLVDDVVVSLDGPPDVHDRIRNVPRAFARLAEGVAAVRAAGPEITVSGRSTVQRVNCRRLRETVETARGIGLLRLSFLAVDVDSDAFNRPGGWEPDHAVGVAPAREDLPFLEAEIDGLSDADFANGFLAESREKLRRRLLAYFRALLVEQEFPLVECNAPWVSSVIESDGTVRPCFFQPPLGNVRRAGSLAAVLNSDEALAFRRGLDTTRDAICRRCVCSLNLREDGT